MTTDAYDNYLLFCWFGFGLIIIFLWMRSCFFCHEALVVTGRERRGGQEINTVSALADGRLNDLPPAYTKDSPPPPYETCMELENPPPYDACPLQMNAINNAAPNAENASVQIQITNCDNSVRIPMESGGH